MRSALITGITGQDGAYLSELLLDKGYAVFGLQRRTSHDNTIRLKKYLGNKFHKVKLFYGDITDSSNVSAIIAGTKPDEIYNLAAQSHVGVSFYQPELSNDCNAMGIVRILESVRLLGLVKKTRIYQASTSELFGSTPPPQNEQTPFHPRSPYAISKLSAYWCVRNYREAYNGFACNGILFNHESPLRGIDFVTSKIVRGLCSGSVTNIGNLDAKRDWGHAKDYVRAMWLMLQARKPDDFVIATGKQYTVRQFAEAVAGSLGKTITWKGRGENETGMIGGVVVMRVDKSLYRPSEVDSLMGDNSKARARLNWKPEISFTDLVAEMAHHEINNINRGV